MFSFLRIFAVVLSAVFFFLVMMPAPLPAEEETPHVDSRHWTRKYDRYFRKYSKRFFGAGFDWRWFKAQAIAESGLDEDAQSWVNAKGIMQIMPRTFEEIREKNPEFKKVTSPRWNIAAGIYYDRQQYRKWKAVPLADRLKFTFASYNAGYGTIRRARRVSLKEGLKGDSWDDVEAVAPKVPRWRHRETLNYIEKITGVMER